MLAATASLVADDALVAYLHDPAGAADAIDERWWRRVASADASPVARERYLHRYLADGSRFELVGVVWRLRRSRR